MVKAVTQRRVPQGTKLRVLVVDDSVVIRRLVTHALTEDPQIEVVGTAANGLIALQKIPQVNPDALVLDVEMPELDGLQTLKRLRKQNPHLCVIMFSTLTERGATATIEALSAGANDYVLKAANSGSLDKSLGSLRAELVPKIKQFFLFGDTPPLKQAMPGESARHCKSPALKIARRAVLIGVSTGGPTALAEIVSALPADFDLPIAIVQHMPPMFTRLLAERLDAITKLEVCEAAEGMAFKRGTIVIAPGDLHLTFGQDRSGVVIRLNSGPRENSCRPAADVMFRSAAQIYGGGVIATVLTGMGQDGLRGVEHLKAKGAFVIAQDEATSVVWGMPGFVARAGLADSILPLNRIAAQIIQQIRQ